jgi:hypothetical protein
MMMKGLHSLFNKTPRRIAGGPHILAKKNAVAQKPAVQLTRQVLFGKMRSLRLGDVISSAFRRQLSFSENIR